MYSKALDETSDTASDNAYVQVFNLVSNDGRRWGEDDLRRALMAALLLKILKVGNGRNTTFEESKHDSPEKLMTRLIIHKS